MKTLTLTLALALPFMTQAADYSARKSVVDGIEIVQLADTAHNTQVSIVPSVGNMAYEMIVAGKNILWSPYKSPGELKAKPALAECHSLALGLTGSTTLPIGRITRNMC